MTKFTCNITGESQTFCNNLVTICQLWMFLLRLPSGNKPHWTVRYWVGLIFLECYSPDLPLWLGIHSFWDSYNWVSFHEPFSYCTVIIRLLHVQLSNHTQWSNVQLVNALSWYYPPQQVPSMYWTASVTWYTCCKLAHTKILQKVWLTQVLFYIN